MTGLELFFALMIGHALADFSLQTDSMAKGKNRNRVLDNIPPGQKVVVCWYYWLTSHALIHAGAVWLITGFAWFAVAELVLHWLIDFAKCDNRINLHQDQALHAVCKVIYVVLLANYL